MGKSSAALNMAIDEAVLLSQRETSKPTLRFYDWETPAFSFGYFQDITAAVDVEKCRAEGIDLVKRMTGGGTVVHGWELTYTLILPRTAGEISVSEMYQRIGGSLVNAFQELEVSGECYKACPDPPEAAPNICLTNPAAYDVMISGKKLAGVSVRRNRDGIMFQGYISLDMPPATMLNCISVDPMVQQRVREKSTALNVAGRVITRDTLIQAICETFEIGIPFKLGELSLKERAQAETLVDTKYATTAWNFQ